MLVDLCFTDLQTFPVCFGYFETNETLLLGNKIGRLGILRISLSDFKSGFSDGHHRPLHRDYPPEGARPWAVAVARP